MKRWFTPDGLLWYQNRGASEGLRKMGGEARTASPARSEAPPAAPFVARFESVGLHLPEKRIATRDLMASCRRAARVDLEKLTGIRARRVCAEGEDSHSLAVLAAEDCLAHSRHGPEDIEMLISCSITRYRGRHAFVFEPAMSLGIKQAIGAGQAQNFDVSNACAGMLTGVAILNDFIRRGAIRCGMVVSGECITSISDNAARSVRTLASKQLASLTVGDAGAAVIVERAENGARGITSSEFVTFAEYSDLCIGRPCRDAPGAVMHTSPRKLHRAAIGSSSPIVGRALERAGRRGDQLDCVIPHQTSIRAIRAGTKLLAGQYGMPKDVVCNLEEFGNTASTTHFVALYRYLEEERLSPGDEILLLVYGSGLVVGAMTFTMDELGERYGRPH